MIAILEAMSVELDALLVDVLRTRIVTEVEKCMDLDALVQQVDREVRMYRVLVVTEKADGNYSAYAPDLPGCVATGKTVEEVGRNMHDAIEMHVRGLLEDSLPVPESYASSEYMAIAVP